jgi:hypothetical protein
MLRSLHRGLDVSKLRDLYGAFAASESSLSLVNYNTHFAGFPTNIHLNEQNGQFHGFVVE